MLIVVHRRLRQEDNWASVRTRMDTEKERKRKKRRRKGEKRRENGGDSHNVSWLFSMKIKLKLGFGKFVLWLRALATFLQDWSSVPIIHTSGFSPFWFQVRSPWSVTPALRRARGWEPLTAKPTRSSVLREGTGIWGGRWGKSPD